MLGLRWRDASVKGASAADLSCHGDRPCMTYYLYLSKSGFGMLFEINSVEMQVLIGEEAVSCLVG